MASRRNDFNNADEIALTAAPQIPAISFRNVRIPCPSRFRLHVSEARASRRVGNAYKMLARWALDLATGELRFALQWLIAMGTVEFEFVRVHGLYPHKRKTPEKSRSQVPHTFYRQTALYVVGE